MIKSKYIKDILEKIIETESDHDLLSSQLDYLEIKDYEYTWTGLFVHFEKKRIELKRSMGLMKRY